jgi:hypothetical protein
MATRWKFQIRPNQRDIVALGFRMDTVGERVEREVNAVLPYPFKFHRVNKIVVCLGVSLADEKDYIEQLGVGLKQWLEFDLRAYVASIEAEKIQMLRCAIRGTFDWLEKSFSDAQFVAIAKNRLDWLQE